jgi:hypothetical protein
MALRSLLECELVAVDGSQSELLVKKLGTALGVYESARLRMDDIVSISVA